MRGIAVLITKIGDHCTFRYLRERTRVKNRLHLRETILLLSVFRETEHWRRHRYLDGFVKATSDRVMIRRRKEVDIVVEVDTSVKVCSRRYTHRNTLRTLTVHPLGSSYDLRYF